MLKKYLLYYRLYTHIFSKLSPFTTSEKGVLLLCALPFLFNGLFLYLELTSVPSSFFVVSKIVSCFILLGRTLENYFEVNSICPLVNENPGDFFVAQKFVKYALFIRSSAVGGGLALATYTWNLQIEHFVVQRNFNVTQKELGYTLGKLEGVENENLRLKGVENENLRLKVELEKLNAEKSKNSSWFK